MQEITTLDHAVVTLRLDGCYSTFADGATWGAQPHDTPHYDEVTRRCGYLRRWFGARASARLQYCREHEVFHHIVGAVFYRAPSPVLWALAHGETPDPMAAALEEAMVMTLQRWVRAGERPIIGGVPWDALRDQALRLLDA